MKKFLLICMVVVPGWLLAQPKETGKDVERIIITKKGNSSEKLNIVLDGDKITVNGKAVSDDTKGDITVQRMKIKDLDNFSPEMQRRRFNNSTLMPVAPNKAMLGVATEKTDKGVTVRNVSENSAAEKAGLQEGDIITEVDGKSISTPDELSQSLKDKSPGDKVSITYSRDGKKATVQAMLTKWEAPRSMTFGPNTEFYGNPAPNFDIEEFMNRFPRNYQGGNNNRMFTYPDANSGPKLGIKIQELATASGVKIMEVEKGSAAEKAGLKVGDIIKEANGEPIKSTEELAMLTRSNKEGSNIKVKIERNGNVQNFTIHFTKKLKSASI